MRVDDLGEATPSTELERRGSPVFLCWAFRPRAPSINTERGNLSFGLRGWCSGGEIQSQRLVGGWKGSCCIRVLFEGAVGRLSG